MGWFSRKRSSPDDQGRQAAEEPFVVDDQAVVQVARLMDRFSHAVGDFDSVLTVAGDIASAAGIQSFEQLLRINNVEVALGRPWKMLSAVAQRAAQYGDHVLAGKVWGFTFYWDSLIFPKTSKADWVDTRMSGCPEAIKAEIAIAAFRSLLQLPANQIIFSNATGSIDAGSLTRAAANTLVEISGKGVAVDAADVIAARSVLEQG